MKIAAALMLWPVFSHAQTDKIAFLRNQELFTADQKGLDVKKLTRGTWDANHPKWSPDGTRIAVQVPGSRAANPYTHAIIDVIDAAGNVSARVPVFASEKDGKRLVNRGPAAVVNVWFSGLRKLGQGSRRSRCKRRAAASRDQRRSTPRIKVI